MGGYGVSGLTINLQTDTTRTVYATWSKLDVSLKKKLKSNPKENRCKGYKYRFYYMTNNNIWFPASDNWSETSSNNNVGPFTYNAPGNAIKARIEVQPISSTYSTGSGKKKKNHSYFTAETKGSEYTFHDEAEAPSSAPTPNVSVKDHTLTAYVEVTDRKIDLITFEVLYLEGSNLKSAQLYHNVNIINNRATIVRTIASGTKYVVRAKQHSSETNKWSEDWSSVSSEVISAPPGPARVSASVDSDLIVTISWEQVNTATSFTVEYTTNENYFDSSSSVQSMNVTNNKAIIPGLQLGTKWYFRVKAVNEQGESGWSSIVNVLLGKKPSPPTTWSTTTSAQVGQHCNLYWVHNAQDGSKETSAEIQIIQNGVTNTVTVTKKDTDEEQTSFYSLETGNYMSKEGDIRWKVRTKGILNEYSDFSTERTIKVYAPPSLLLTCDTELTSYPYRIHAEAGPPIQKPTGYYLSISANESYTTVGFDGEDIDVGKGALIYSKYYDIQDRTLDIELTPSEVILPSGHEFEIRMIVSMDTGLTAEASKEFTTNLGESDYILDASVVIDETDFYASIIPVAYYPQDTFNDVEGSERDDYDDFVKNLNIAVYRHNYDGSLTLIQDNIENGGNIIDPHPSLNYARYRIVAIDQTNGDIEYYDLPDIGVGETSIIMQWNEDISSIVYDDDNDETPSEDGTGWKGERLYLPFNVATSENYSPDVSLIEYIGRKYPVSYYGTQKGVTASWTAAIERDDDDTLDQIRKLAAWSGDVYVREPSGAGYWANVNVSISITRKELTVPVTFEIKRVEGDV